MAKARKKAVKAVTELRPRDARTIKTTAMLRNNTRSYAGFWILLDGDGTLCVTIAKQREGEKCEEMIHIPRRVFDKMVDWYMKPQQVTENKRKP